MKKFECESTKSSIMYIIVFIDNYLNRHYVRKYDSELSFEIIVV